MAKFDAEEMWQANMARTIFEMRDGALRADADARAGIRDRPPARTVVPRVAERFLKATHYITNGDTDRAIQVIDLMSEWVDDCVKRVDVGISDAERTEFITGMKTAMVREYAKRHGRSAPESAKVVELNAPLEATSHISEFLALHLDSATEEHFIGDRTPQEIAASRHNRFILFLLFFTIVHAVALGTMDKFAIDRFGVQSARAYTLSRMSETTMEYSRQTIRRMFAQQDLGIVWRVWNILKTIGVISEVQTNQFFDVSGINVAQMTDADRLEYEEWSHSIYTWVGAITALSVIGIVITVRKGYVLQQEAQSLRL